MENVFPFSAELRDLPEDFRVGVATPAMPSLQEWEGILRRLAALVDRLEQAIEKLELDEIDDSVLRDD